MNSLSDKQVAVFYDFQGPPPTIWQASLPLSFLRSNSTKDIHLKFAAMWKTRDFHALFHLHFEGILFESASPLSFRVVGYLEAEKGLTRFGVTNESGPVTVSRAYPSSDGHLCLVITSFGIDWSNSELSMSFVGGVNVKTQHGAQVMHVIKQSQHGNDF